MDQIWFEQAQKERPDLTPDLYYAEKDASSAALIVRLERTVPELMTPGLTGLDGRLCELEDKADDHQERIATLERANRIQSDHIRGLMTRQNSEPPPRGAQQQHADDDDWEYVQVAEDYLGDPLFTRRPKRR
jgi:hypothetical protein